MFYVSLLVVKGQEPSHFVLSNPQYSYLDLQNVSEVLVDSTRKLTFWQIQLPNYQQKFKPFTKDISNHSAFVHWFKLKVENLLNRDKEFLLEWHFAFDYVEVYYPEYDVYQKLEAGRHQPDSKLTQIGNRYYVQIPFLRNDVKTIYLRLQRDTKKPSVLQFALHDIQHYKTIEFRKEIFYFAILAVIAIMLLYNLLIFVSSNDFAYGWYAFYLFFIGIYLSSQNDLLRKYILFEWIDAIAYMPYIGVYGSMYAYTNFLRKFFETPKFFPSYEQSLRLMVYYFFIFFSVNVLIVAILYDFRLTDMVAPASLAIGFGILIYILFRIGFSRGLAGWLVVGGTISLFGFAMLSVIGTMLNALHLINIPLPNISYFTQLGVIAEILLFSVALGYKARQNEIEKQIAQAKVIEQLRENEELQQKVNRELEQKVSARTAEIQKQKEKLEAFADNLQNANEVISKKNENILASINYAKRIQNAILPSQSLIGTYLPQHFILFKPKDIVSGDFYFFDEQNGFYIIAAIDCTGHGVPGAFMSMVGNALLKEIINEKNMVQPNRILNELHKGIRNALRQSETKANDGMDLALITIDIPNQKFVFAGAKNPVWYIQNNELFEIKGNKTPIGGEQQEEERIFTAQSVEIQNPTMIYLCTDGYEDQFGGKDQRKFGKKQMKELFLNIHQEELPTQKQILEQTFESWKAENKQIDDVLILGIRL